jgi:hypothetical protein
MRSTKKSLSPVERKAELEAQEITLAGADFTEANAEKLDLSRLDLGLIRGRSADFRSATMIGVDLRGAQLPRANLYHADLTGARMQNADLSNTNGTGATLTAARLDYTDLQYARLDHANLTGADLAYVNLSGASLFSCNLAGANLNGADLHGADLAKAKITQTTNLRNTSLDPRIGEYLRRFLRECPAVVRRADPRLLGEPNHFAPRATGRIVYRGQKSVVGNFEYEPGRTYAAHALSWDVMCECHPGIYAGSLAWVATYLSGISTRIVECYVRDGDWTITKKGCIRCRRLRVLRELSYEEVNRIQSEGV